MSNLLEALQPGSRFSSRTQRVAAYLFLCLVCVYFFFRGPWRAAALSVDFPTFYTSARAWLLGLNPYAWDQFLAIAQKSGLQEQQLDNPLTPPMTLVILSPLAIFPYTAAQWLWLAINLLCVGLGLFELLRILEFDWKEPRTISFLILALGLASIHTAISQGQLTIAAFLVLVYALKFDLQNRGTPTGLMLAFAGILKPQIVVTYGLYYLFRRQWLVVIVSAIVGAIALLIVIGRMEIAGVNGLQQWWNNIFLFTRGGGDPAQPPDYSMMNFQVVLHQFIQSHSIVNFIVVVVVVATLLILAATPRYDNSRQDLLLTYSCLATLAPLTLYSRFYTATLLLFPLAWAVLAIRPRYVQLPTLALLCISAFLFPGAAILNVLSRQLSVHILTSWWWRYLLVPHETYALLLLLSCLLIAKLDRRNIPVTS